MRKRSNTTAVRSNRAARVVTGVCLARICGPRVLNGHSQVALKAGIEADEAFVLGDHKVASVYVAPLKGRDRAVEKAGNMPIGPDKDRTEGPAIAWVRRFDFVSASNGYEVV